VAISIVELGHVDGGDVEDLARLLSQLSTTATQLTVAAIDRIVAHEATTLLVARTEAGTIVGALTLVVFPIPTGVRAWIEDVVVDERLRGRGVGESLSRRAVELAADAGARTVELTSRSTRTAANRLYQRLGFERRDTNVYRYTVTPPA
jgi:ribosomal protein S18 acetylase RimI-like enzyme